MRFTLFLVSIASLFSLSLAQNGNEQNPLQRTGNICTAREHVFDFHCNCVGPEGKVNLYIDEKGVGRCCGEGGNLYLLDPIHNLRGVCCLADESFKDGKCQPAEPLQPPPRVPPKAACLEGDDEFLAKESHARMCCPRSANLHVFDEIAHTGACCPAGTSYRSNGDAEGCCLDGYDQLEVIEGQRWCLNAERQSVPLFPWLEKGLWCPTNARGLYLDKTTNTYLCCPNNRQWKIFDWETGEGVCCPEGTAYSSKDPSGRGGRCCSFIGCEL